MQALDAWQARLSAAAANTGQRTTLTKQPTVHPHPTRPHAHAHAYTRQDGKIVSASPAERLASADVGPFQPLPSVVCDHFFAGLARALMASSPTALGTRALPVQRTRVHVRCQVRELDRATGSQLVTRRLAGVREELDDERDHDGAGDHDGDDHNHDHECAKTVRLRYCATGARLDEHQDFGSFLRRQSAPGRAPRPAARHRPRQEQEPEPEPAHCYELFCIHNPDLLVHRNQVAFEAERLASRLAQLT